MNGGITVAGSMLVDNIKMIDCYPDSGKLANITHVSRAVGGCVPNTAIDLAAIDSDLPVFAVGRIGRDNDGRFLKEQLASHGVDVTGIKTDTLPTAFTDVMTVKSSGERTFFHARGANVNFSADDIPRTVFDRGIFHIGYLLLLDALDREHAEYGTAMAKLLSDVRAHGVKTSIDVVSECGDRFRRIVTPALKFCDYVIINEIEGGEITGVCARRPDGTLSTAAVRTITQRLMQLGVQEKAIVHCPEGGFCRDRNGEFTAVASLKLPKDYIVGTVGAGDAFCACCLYAIYHGFNDERMLKFASCGAACNLSAADAVSGMRSAAEIERLDSIYQRGTLNFAFDTEN